MKSYFLALLLIPSISFAGTITTAFNPLGSISISSGTAAEPGAGIFWDAVSTSPVPSAAPTITWNHTVGSNTNRFIAVGCGANPTGTVTGVTVGGNAMTLSTSATDSSSWKTYFYTYVAPASGVQSIVVSITGNDSRLACGAVSWYGVNQATPVDLSTSSFNGAVTALTTGITTTGANEVITDVVADSVESVIEAPGASQGSKWTIDMAANSFAVYGSTRAVTTAGNYAMTWSSLSSGSKVVSAIAIKPAP